MSDTPRYPVLRGGERLVRPVEDTGGGGTQYFPRSYAEAVAHLRPQVQRVRDEVARMPSDLRGSRIVVELDVLPNFLAITSQPGTLLGHADVEWVGADVWYGDLVTGKRRAEKKMAPRVFGAATPQGLDQLLGALASEEQAGRFSKALRNDVRKLEAIRLPSVERIVRVSKDVDLEVEQLWEVVLHPIRGVRPGDREAEHARVFERFALVVDSLGGQLILDAHRHVGDVEFTAVRLPGTALYELARFNPIRAIRRWPVLTLTGRRKAARAPLQLPVPLTTGLPADAPRIACFDGGVDPSCPYLGPFVRAYEATDAPVDSALGLHHGHLVCGTALFGSVDGRPLEVPPVGVDHYRVYPAPQTVDPVRALVDEIEQAVRLYGYPIVILSLKYDVLRDDQGPHYLSRRLDELAQETGTLFILAAGNDGETANSRIGVPADMVNGLTVGACTARTGTVRRAPYSSVGPGRPGLLIKPTGVAPGGTATAPFEGIGLQGGIASMYGTSFSAPMVAHGLARLMAELGPSADANTLRALAVHSIERRVIASQMFELGYGRFRERYDHLFTGQPDSITVLYQGLLHRNEVAGIKLPLPPALAGAANVTLQSTFAYTSPVDPSSIADYTVAGLDVAFRPNADVYTFRLSNDEGDEEDVDSQEVNVRRDDARAGALIAAGYKQSARPLTKPLNRKGRREPALRAAGKWETIIAHAPMTMPINKLHEPEYDVWYFARREGRMLTQDVPPLPYTLVVTITAPGSTLYESARAQFPVLTPVQITTQLKV